MTDREMIINALAETVSAYPDGEGWEPTILPLWLIRKTLELLKEQRDVEEDDGK